MDPTHVGAGLSFVIADDHPMVRDALASALRSAFDAPAPTRAPVLAGRTFTKDPPPPRV